jgi:hypothetical protein
MHNTYLVKVNEHETIDVLAGTAIGLACSAFFTTPYENLNVSANLTKDNMGMTVIYNYSHRIIITTFVELDQLNGRSINK